MSGHGGNTRERAQAAGVPARDLVDFSASINPIGPPRWLRDVLLANLDGLAHYPDPDCEELVGAISARYGLAPQRIVAGNGSAEIIAALPRVISAARAVIPVPAYVDYAAAAAEAGLPVETLGLDEGADFALDLEALSALMRPGDLVFLGRPNNPTGTLYPADSLTLLIDGHPRTWFVVDEAFVEFVEDERGSADPGLLGLDRPNLVVVRSLTKIYAIPGLRLGFAVLPPTLASRLRRTLTAWSVNSLAQAVGVAALADPAYLDTTRTFVTVERRRLVARLSELPGLRIHPASANYLLVRVERAPLDAEDIAGRLLRQGIAIRVCSDFEGLDRRYFRVAVRTREQDDLLVDALRALLS